MPSTRLHSSAPGRVRRKRSAAWASRCSRASTQKAQTCPERIVQAFVWKIEQAKRIGSVYVANGHPGWKSLKANKTPTALMRRNLDGPDEILRTHASYNEFMCVAGGFIPTTPPHLSCPSSLERGKGKRCFCSSACGKSDAPKQLGGANPACITIIMTSIIMNTMHIQ